MTGKPVDELTDKEEEEIVELCKGKQPGNHMKKFFECVGGKPISDVWSHHRSASVCHLANIAMRLNRMLESNPKKEVFVSDDEVNGMLSRPQREPYTVT